MEKRFATILGLTLTIAFLSSTNSIARPVNPATGWLSSLEMDSSAWKLEFAKDPYFESGSTKSYPYKDTGLEVSDITQSDGSLQLAFGYGWPRFAAEIYLGNRTSTIEWKETQNGVHTKDIRAEGLGGSLYGLRLSGCIWKGDVFSIGLGSFIAVSPNWRVKVWEIPDGKEKFEYRSDVPLSSYDASLVMAEGGIDLTGYWTLGSWVPWVALDARKVTSIIDLQINNAGIPISGKDFVLQPTKGSGLTLGIDWRFTNNLLARLAIEAGNPGGAFLSINTCSGERP